LAADDASEQHYGAHMASGDPGARFRAVVFDFFGTLVPSAPPTVWLDHAQRVAAPMGLPGEALMELLHSSFADRAVGALGDLPSTLRALARRLDVEPTPDQLSRACQVRRDVHAQLFEPRPDALAVLDELRAAGLRIGVLTDCTVELPEAWSGLPLARRIDEPVFSCSVGMRKPDPGLFALIAARLAVPPSSCLYIGDGGGRELTGATEAGMTAVLLAERDHGVDSAFEVEADWGGLRISRLAEVPTLVFAKTSQPPLRVRGSRGP
jgi:putative hydrolase of the HAD superfamily